MKKNSIRRWIILCFTAVLTLSVAASAAANYFENSNDIMEDYGRLAETCAYVASNLFVYQWNNDEVLGSVGTKAYNDAANSLRGLCKTYKLDSLSIYRVDPSVPARYYYFYVSPVLEENQELQREYALRTIPAAELLPGEEALINGSREMQIEAGDQLPDDKIIWVSPVNDLNGSAIALISMVCDIGLIQNKIHTDFLRDILPFSMSLLVGLLILLYLVQRRIIRPIGILSDGMRQFALDSRKKPEPLKLRSGDEIGEIAEAFEKMTDDISTYVNSIEKLTQKETEINTQLELGRRVQCVLVPERTTRSGDGWRVNAITRPAKTVGGDFYDCFSLDDSRVCVVMGDVSGKGIGAAISMAMVKTVIREKLTAGFSPAETLNRTNDQIAARNPENQFATAFVAVLNTKTGELLYCNAGHNPPLMLREKCAFLNPEPGIALGVFENAGLKNASYTLSPGQGILLYTDGVTEAVSPQRQFFGEERLREAVGAFSAGENAAEETVLRLIGAVDDFCGGNEAFDDMAVLALVYRGGDGTWRSLPVELSAFDTVRRAVLAAVGDSHETRQALLACDEALANIVSYSGAATLAYSCKTDGDRLCVAFSDNGVPFDQTAAVLEDREFERLDGGGMGLHLIRRCASSMRYERKEDRNILTLFFPLPPSSEHLNPWHPGELPTEI